MNAQQANSQRIAEYLHGLGFPTLYPGLPSHPGKALHDSQSKGAGAVVSFRTDSISLSEKIVNGTCIWGISVSFGCVNSLISMPCQMSHASIDPKVRKERNLPEDLIRLCVGIEDVDDLIEDLQNSLLAAGAIKQTQVPDPSFPGGKRCVRAPVTLDEEIEPNGDTESITQDDQELLISAPGKVILFGEHAVVHGAVRVVCIEHAKDLKLIFYRLLLLDPSIFDATVPSNLEQMTELLWFYPMLDSNSHGRSQTFHSAEPAFQTLYLFQNLWRPSLPLSTPRTLLTDVWPPCLSSIF